MSEVFAAIDVGSYELGMKVFELSGKRGLNELDHVVHRLDLGSETYASGHIPEARIAQLISILKEFRTVMDSYGVSPYRAWGTSALRETRDVDIVLNRILNTTGIEVRILSNSEQRFLQYKAVAMRGDAFTKIIEKPTAILDIGGGSIQLSVFDRDKLTATQNMRLGILRMQQALRLLDAPGDRYRKVIRELAAQHIDSFKLMHMHGRSIRNLIIIDDYFSPILCHHRIGKMERGYASRKDFSAFIGKYEHTPQTELAKKIGVPVERLALVEIAAVLIESVVEGLDAGILWAPGVSLCDGIAYDYAERKKYIVSRHDFEHDIIAAASNMSGRYMGSGSREKALSDVALAVFDAIRKTHGMGARERLLLQIAAILHDCGKYISMLNMSDCSYHIIMSTEMIGLSHRERELVANVVRMTHTPFEARPGEDVYYGKLGAEDRLVVSKLASILRVAGGLDQTRIQKFKEVKVRLKDGQLVLGVDGETDSAIERGLFDERSRLFETVYGIRPVIRPEWKKAGAKEDNGRKKEGKTKEGKTKK